MTVFDKHYSKYSMFKKDALNESISAPMRIEAYFYASFHLIEAIAARHGIHIEKHQKVRSVLEEFPWIFGDKSETLWRTFLEIENQIRLLMGHDCRIIWEIVDVIPETRNGKHLYVKSLISKTGKYV